ncbi:diguanylate cyclase/phosphodiesterase [gamma proteobacterium HTCC5015]|nr:diguanylate cyclase/phosphodiesterase [gamma proteobacterium HTCC5015]
MATKPFRTRLLGQFIGLSITIGLLITLAVLFATERNVQARVEQQMLVGEKVLQALIETRQNLLTGSAQILTSDFGFKKAVAVGDRATTESALSNQARRIGADLMLLLSLEGDIMARDSNTAIDSQQMPPLANMALSKGKVAGFSRIGDDLYQVIVLPVKAPTPIALTVVGFRVDQELAEKLKELTNLDIAFITHASRDEVTASTLDESQVLKADNEIHGLSFFSQRVSHIKSSSEFDLLWGGSMDVVLLSHLDSVYRDFDRLSLQIVGTALVAVLLSLILAAISSKRLVEPVSKLASGARRIARGHYEEPVEADSEVLELSELSQAINGMQDEIRQREEKILYQANHDHLTGLLLSAKLLQSLRGELSNLREFALLTIGSPQLRDINNAFGHEVGDACLVEVAKRLEPFTASQSHACRIRNYFKLRIDDVSNLETLMHDVIATLEMPYWVQGLRLQMNFNIGVAHYPDQADDADSVWRRSNMALDTATSEQLKIGYYRDGEDQKRTARVELINDLRKQLQNKEQGEVFMAYQPKRRLDDNTVSHAEALIRWVHPELGFVSPEDFIPLAEQTGLINELSRWVVSQVAAQIARWRSQGIRMSVAINLSAEDLFNAETRLHIEKVLHDFDLEPSAISFEVTESAVIRDNGDERNLIGDLRDKGFSIAVDDFGTGYSSLEQLKKVPVSHLKIDKSFVLQLAQNREDQIIVRSTIELAHQLGLEVIAEGVEDAQSEQLLKEYGCDWVQGYYLAKPMNADDFNEWLASHNETA